MSYVTARTHDFTAEKECCRVIESADFKGHWPCIWALVETVESIEPDKQLTVSLRDIRAILHGEALDSACAVLRQKLLTTLAGGRELLRKLEAGPGRLRQAVKAILNIGSNLSQSREYKDIYEDMIQKVGDLLFVEWGLSKVEMNRFFLCCNQLVCGNADSFPKMF